ncbi:putative uncharacterized protein DDB_G0277003 isoform X1 [Ananas comosus]|uniref:Protein-lysine N-methyltransferase EEF2KMT n=2 Tax=Ananas comosus TaxID=4615 RepID=A0A6P5H0K7_ANACO|nr:putative uncharacterized protein DDB_G0277003 isoform X1 [Ananas comosus]
MDIAAGTSEPMLMYLKLAFLAMEPPNFLISLARQCGGGSITPRVQSFILEHCMGNIVDQGTSYSHTYIRNILKKIIVDAESSSDVVVDGLYEEFGQYLTLNLEEGSQKENDRIYRQVSFLSSTIDDDVCSKPVNLVVRLVCSLNMLEGDTGCSLWPSSLFLSEFILSYPEIFSNKFNFEVGSGVGLVGIALNYVGASKVILSDGDMSTLTNMKANVELNCTNGSSNRVAECKYLPWESASEAELQQYRPDIVLGADVIYNPQCLPHLIRVLSILLKPQNREEVDNRISLHEAEGSPVSYIATVVRNLDTFNYFLRLASEANLLVLNISETAKPLNLLPYMLSYDQSNVRLLKISLICD